MSMYMPDSGEFIEEDHDDGPSHLRDYKGHYLPKRPAGVRVMRFDEDLLDGYVYRHYDDIPLDSPWPPGWEFDEEYYACKVCGHVLASDTREVY